MRYEDVKGLLSSNFCYVQNKVERIQAHSDLHVKQIEDLKRYFEMQRTIVESMVIAKGLVIKDAN